MDVWLLFHDRRTDGPSKLYFEFSFVRFFCPKTDGRTGGSVNYRVASLKKYKY